MARRTIVFYFCIKQFPKEMYSAKSAIRHEFITSKTDKKYQKKHH